MLTRNFFNRSRRHSQLSDALQKIPESLFGKAHSNVVVVFKHGALDECRIVDHCGERLVPAHIAAIHLGNLSPGEALSVEQRLPADSVGPALQHLDVETIVTYVMKRMFNIFVREIFACLPARVAAFYSVNRQQVNLHSVIARTAGSNDGLPRLFSASQKFVQARFCTGLCINMFHYYSTVQRVFSVGRWKVAGYDH